MSRITDHIERFYDPLYELNVFSTRENEKLFHTVFGGSKQDGGRNMYRELLGTYEMSRLFHLKQAGISYLIFPSATHNRFAHSVGTWTLGTYVLQEAKVMIRNSGTSSNFIDLAEYLQSERGDRSYIAQSFLVALLLHDVAHKPFSHVLEVNESLRKANVTSHEETSLDIIHGTGKLYDIFSSRAKENSLETIHSILEKYEKRGIVSKDIITRLLSGEVDDSILKPLHELVSGVLDLDRLDHYNRDSYFMGIKLAGVGIKSILENIIIDESSNRIYVHEEGETHVLHLLFAKELLGQKGFDIDKNRSYESMLNRAVTMYIDSSDDPVEMAFRIASFTDDELVGALSSDRRTDTIMKRITFRNPYTMVYKKVINNDSERVKKRFREFIESKGFSEDDWLLNIPLKHGKPSSWMKVNVLNGDRTVEALGRNNSGLIQYFESQEEERNNTVRVFASDRKSIKPELHDELNRTLTSI